MSTDSTKIIYTMMRVSKYYDKKPVKIGRAHV